MIMELVVYGEGKVSYTELWEMSHFERALYMTVLNSYNKAKSGKGSDEL